MQIGVVPFVRSSVDLPKLRAGCETRPGRVVGASQMERWEEELPGQRNDSMRRAPGARVCDKFGELQVSQSGRGQLWAVGNRAGKSPREVGKRLPWTLS